MAVSDLGVLHDGTLYGINVKGDTVEFEVVLDTGHTVRLCIPDVRDLYVTNFRKGNILFELTYLEVSGLTNLDSSTFRWVSGLLKDADLVGNLSGCSAIIAIHSSYGCEVILIGTFSLECLTLISVPKAYAAIQ